MAWVPSHVLKVDRYDYANADVFHFKFDNITLFQLFPQLKPTSETNGARAE